MVRVLRSPVHDLVTTVFPAECRCCDGPLEEAGPVPVCGACVERLTLKAHSQRMFGCDCCGEAINLDLDLEDMRFAGLLAEGFRCRECRLAPPAFTRAVAFGTYTDELRALIHLLKFEGVRAAAGLLGSRLGEAITQLDGLTSGELLVVAVPLFRARERERGFNQSVLLADAGLRWLRRARPEWKLKRAHSLLRRVKRTESQYVLSPKGRRRNLRGAFETTGNVSGREVLLIDDILTSGATARECARVLVAAGAARVWVATVARAQKRFIQRQHEQPGELVAMWDLGTTT